MDEYYHLYNRGSNKMDIFKDETDYRRFQALLFLANGTNPVVFRDIEKDEIFSHERGEQQVYLGAYCLMPNHFHILLTPAVENGVQNFMQKLATSYSMYFNRKYERTGVLFEGRFKSQHAGEDRYLRYLFSYVHLNPVKLIQHDWRERGIGDLAATHKYLSRYAFSSYSDYLGAMRDEYKLLTPSRFPEYFCGKSELDHEMMDWLRYKDET
jgi:putative transposase